jgi:hypothetical protein
MLFVSAVMTVLILMHKGKSFVHGTHVLMVGSMLFSCKAGQG